MKRLFGILICLCFLVVVPDFAFAGEHYKGNDPPSLEVIQSNVEGHGGKQISGIKVIGIHKERKGAYLVITDRNSNSWGGPYQLLRLESGKWVMKKPGQLFTQYVFITK